MRNESVVEIAGAGLLDAPRHLSVCGFLCTWNLEIARELIGLLRNSDPVKGEGLEWYSVFPALLHE